MPTVEESLWVPQALGKLGEFYWSLYRTREELRGLAECPWKVALAGVLKGYAFERAGASPRYSQEAAAAIMAYEPVAPRADLEAVVWQDFLKRLGLPESGKGANPQNIHKPVLSSEGTRPATRLISTSRAAASASSFGRTIRN
jgi:hypothetical protein